jgi:HEAT repeat protein
MSVKTMIACLAAALVLSWAGPCVAAEEGVDKAFEVLKTYDWGTDRDLLKAIDDAVVASHKDAAARKELEARLAAVLKTDASRAAKDYVCRKLSLIGTAASVPALAALLPDENLSHMARYALERMPCKEAVAAMRDALPKVKGRVKVGVINSLGVRRDAESLPALVALLKDSDQEVAAAAVAALGSVGNLEAAKALGAFRAPEALKLAAADAQLTCGERLLADGKKDEAELVYKRLLKLDQPKHVRVAATLGLLAVKGAK